MKKLLLIFPLLLLLGCVANKQYRVGPKSIITADPASASVEGCEPKPGTPCMAFLEFDDFGEMFEPQQLYRATELIGRSRTPDKHPVIIAFIHGWKNNADPKRDRRQEGNAFGFGQALAALAKKYPNTPVIGVYMAWRGELVSKYWPIRRQFSYFNREEAATRIPGARMTDALARLVRATRDVDGYAILVGHSFGGLVMERALTQATVERLEQRPLSADPCFQANGTGMGADLTVFVNSAAAATEAKQMLDVLKDYKPCDPPSDKPRSPDTALFISISSQTDAATKFALPIGHAIPFLRYKFNGSLRDSDPLAHSDQPISQGSFYMSSAAHMPILQSHEVKRREMKECQENNDNWQFFSLPDTKECFKIDEKAGAWNDTSYWLMEVPPEIIPDHSTIFTGRFIAMLQKLVPTNEQVEKSAPAGKMMKQIAR